MGTRRRRPAERWWLWAIGAGAAVLVAITAPTQALAAAGGRVQSRSGRHGTERVRRIDRPSPTIASWPGTGAGDNGGPFAFVGAHHGSLWGVPAGDNNSTRRRLLRDGGRRRLGHRGPPTRPGRCGTPSEMARAGALMSTFGGDRVVPYGIDDTGTYDVDDRRMGTSLAARRRASTPGDARSP